MFQLPVCCCNVWTEIIRIIAVDKGTSSKPRKYSLYQVRHIFVLIFPTVHLTVHYELVDVEPATHGEGAQAEEVQPRDDKVSVTLGPFIPLCCDHLDTVVDMDQSNNKK